MQTIEPNEAGHSPEYLTTRQAMRLFDYASNKGFLDFVKQQGVPCLRLNQRRILFPRAALTAWIRRRTVGAQLEASHE